MTSRPHRHLFLFAAAFATTAVIVVIVVVIMLLGDLRCSSRRNGDANGIPIDPIRDNLTSRKNALDGIGGCPKFLVATVSVAALLECPNERERERKTEK